MRALFVDDDVNYCDVFFKHLNQCCKELGIEIECDACYDSGKVLEIPVDYDIYFLDIEMAGMDGLELARKIRENFIDKEIVFISFHEKYVWKSFEAKPSAFIRKNRLDTDLYDALKLIMEHNRMRQTTIEFPVNNVNSLTLKPMEILYCRSEEHYVKFILMKEESELYRIKLNKVEEILKDYHFVRVHSRYLINLEYVQVINTDNLEMINGHKIPISRTYQKRIHRILFSWKKRKENLYNE